MIKMFIWYLVACFEIASQNGFLIIVWYTETECGAYSGAADWLQRAESCVFEGAIIQKFESVLYSQDSYQPLPAGGQHCCD